MSDFAYARTLALSLPETTEHDHHGMPSFRVRGKIFATVPDHEHIRIMLDEHEIHAAVADNPEVCADVYWGKRLSCVVVNVSKASRGLLAELITEAWLRKVPKAVARDFLNCAPMLSDQAGRVRKSSVDPEQIEAGAWCARTPAPWPPRWWSS